MNAGNAEFQSLLYRTAEDNLEVDALLKDETIWMTQKAMGQLFGVQKAAISKHLNNIYEEGELQRSATVSKMETVQKEGTRTVTRQVEYYNLDVIISVGYRVNSKKATNFRIWATGVLKEYIAKGYAMDDARLKELAEEAKENMEWRSPASDTVCVGGRFLEGRFVGSENSSCETWMA